MLGLVLFVFILLFVIAGPYIRTIKPTRIANAIITETALSFPGLGFPSDVPTWGRLLFDGTDYLRDDPERVIWPGLAISLTVLSVNYIGDGLRDALAPRISGRDAADTASNKNSVIAIGAWGQRHAPFVWKLGMI